MRAVRLVWIGQPGPGFAEVRNGLSCRFRLESFEYPLVERRR
jgi:hypothetical protein